MDASVQTPDIHFDRVACGGSMWLTAQQPILTDAGPISLKGYIPESKLALQSRWAKLEASVRDDLANDVHANAGDKLIAALKDAGSVVAAYVKACHSEMLDANLSILRSHWDTGLLNLDTVEEDLSMQLAEMRTANRQRSLAAEVANAVRLADYPATFEAAGRARKLIAVLGPTNSGKTHEAFERLASAQSGVYLGPLRLLALEAFNRLNEEFGVTASLVTGEERRLVEGSRVTASTIEMLDTQKAVEVAVIDEIQMLNDPDRGWAWTQAVVGANANEVWVLGAPSALPAIQALAQRLNLPLEVRRKERKQPLDLGKPLATRPGAALHHAKPGDAFIVFSRRDALNLRDDLIALKRTVACIYGALSPEVREREAQRFSSGEAELLVATDAIGLGLNLPIRRVVFTAVQKYDGVSRGELSVPLLQQIAGRAGRFGMDEARGVVAGVTSAEHEVVAKLLAKKQVDLPTAGFQITATASYLETMARLTRETRLEALLSHFLLNSDHGDGFFLPHVPEEQLKRAVELDALGQLDLATKQVFSMAPMASQVEALDNIWRNWARSVSKGAQIGIDFLSSNPRHAALEEAEDAVRLLAAYRWFAYRLPESFTELERATQLLDPWIAAVDNHLRSKIRQGQGGGRDGAPSWYWGSRN